MKKNSTIMKDPYYYDITRSSSTANKKANKSSSLNMHISFKQVTQSFEKEDATIQLPEEIYVKKNSTIIKDPYYYDITRSSSKAKWVPNQIFSLNCNN